MKRFLISVLFLLSLIVWSNDICAENYTPLPQDQTVEARGCCSWHGGVCGCSGGRALCCDGSLSPSCGC